MEVDGELTAPITLLKEWITGIHFVTPFLYDLMVLQWQIA